MISNDDTSKTHHIFKLNILEQLLLHVIKHLKGYLLMYSMFVLFQFCSLHIAASNSKHPSTHWQNFQIPKFFEDTRGLALPMTSDIPYMKHKIDLAIAFQANPGWAFSQ